MPGADLLEIRKKIVEALEWTCDKTQEYLGAAWDQFVEKPLDTVMIVLVLFALCAFLTGKVLKRLSPQNTLIVAPFENPVVAPSVLPSTTPLVASGKVIADLLKDEITTILHNAKLTEIETNKEEGDESAVAESNHAENTGSPPGPITPPGGTYATPTVPSSSILTLADTPHVVQVGLEVQGISLEKLYAIYSAIREDEHQIQGNVLIFDGTQEPPMGCAKPPTGPPIIILRARIEDVGEWTTCPQTTDAIGLRNATRELAVKIMRDFGPRTLGLAYLKTGRQAESIPIFRELTARDPEDVNAQQDLALAQYMHNDFVEAIAQYRDLLARAPTYPEQVHNNLGLALYSNGQVEEAKAEFRKAIGLNWNYAAPHINLGNVLGEQDDRDGARVEYELAVQSDSTDADAHYSLGRAMDYQFRIKDAVKEYRRAAHLRPRKAEIHVDLGLELDKLGDPAGALTEYVEALRLRPKVWWTHSFLGTLYSEMGEFKKAVAEHESALKFEDVPDAHTNYGWTFEIAGKYSEAVDQYCAALRLNPDYTEARGNLARVLKRIDDSEKPGENGEFEAAVNNYDEASRSMKPPDAAAALREYVYGFRDQKPELSINGDPDFAVHKLSESIEQRPDPETYVALGYAYFLKREDDMAIVEFRRALMMRADDTDAHTGLGEVFEDQGQYPKALAEYREAVQSAPHNSYAERHLASLLEEVTDYDGAVLARQNAIAGYKLAVKQRPHDIDNHTELSIALAEAGDYQGAQSEAELAMAEIPTRGEAHNERGVALEKLARQDEALQAYNNAVNAPNQASGLLIQYYLNIGYLLDNEGEHTAALNAYQQILKNFPKEPWTHMQIAVADMGLGQDEAAIAELDIAAQGSDFPEIHRFRCRTLNEQRNYAAAIDECRTALESLPHDSYSHILLGDALLGKSKNCHWCFSSSEAGASAAEYESAIRDAQSLLRIRPDADAQYFLGRALLSAHQDGAVEALRSALQLRPKFPLADYWLGLALNQTGHSWDAEESGREMGKALKADPYLSRSTN
jgi:tetratricopeptide (TPR) repeat protein